LLTSELVTNSVKHSNSRRDGGTITITLWVGVDRALVEVADDGGTTVPTLRHDDGLAESGRGLWLVNAYSLGWGYHRGGDRIVTWFECAPEPLP
jgi:two-component sensor histidine kinase